MKRFILLFLVLSLGSLPATAQEPPPAAAVDAKAAQNNRPFSYTQLRNQLMDFADRYMQMVGQAADQLQRENKDPDRRAAIHSLKLFPCSAAFSIAIDANPQMAVLDMVVLVHLQGSVWKDGLKERYGDAAAPLLEAQQNLEEEIDLLARRVLTAEKLKELKELIMEWRKAFPDQRYVSYIRFSDFSQEQRVWRRRSGGNPLSIAGLLSAFQLVNMDETTRSLDQTRMVAERALYLSQRMPTLLRWQTQMLFYEIASSPESKNVMATSQALQNFPAEMEKRGRALIWEAAKAATAVIFAAFCLALLYKKISRKN